MRPRLPAAPQHSGDGLAPATWYVEAEAHLREAGRKLEVVGLVDAEAARLALIIYRLAQRVAVDSGRLERAA